MEINFNQIIRFALPSLMTMGDRSIITANGLTIAQLEKTHSGRDLLPTPHRDSLLMREWPNEMQSTARSVEKTTILTGGTVQEDISIDEQCARSVRNQPEDVSVVDLSRQLQDECKVVRKSAYEQHGVLYSPLADFVDTRGNLECEFEDLHSKGGRSLRIDTRTATYLPPTVSHYMDGNEIDKFQNACYVYFGVPQVREPNSFDLKRAPRFHMPLTSLREIPEGTEMLLTCVVIGLPAPSITWLKNGERLTPEHTKTRCENGVCTLIIAATTVNDSGSYTCVAVNDHGTATTTTTVVIIPPHGNNYTAPKFVELLANQCVLENDEITLECYVIGKPIPSVIWYKDGLKLMIEDRMLQYMDRKGYTKLNIMEAVQRDSGDYTCAAYNVTGKDFTHCRVQVIGMNFGKLLLSSSSSPSHSCNSLLTLSLNQPRAPVITRALVNTVVNIGGRELLELEVDGVPTPTVEWYHDGKLIAESRTLRTYFDGRVAFLKIFEAQLDHQGHYVCKVRRGPTFRPRQDYCERLTLTRCLLKISRHLQHLAGLHSSDLRKLSHLREICIRICITVAVFASAGIL
ncbi:hypothetical protein KIN20_034512 [Parelaphostrongylus tenuis]|uniref:Ig-like domain-containing protein n=1 Tax=Parelaphostrongylus tenuis TaxID=148309 RepID=A0AAD5R9S8_PARTN|nr:hypothetical protein KIN20_034512 [Parelaphostrongylus tenuis]